MAAITAIVPSFLSPTPSTPAVGSSRSQTDNINSASSQTSNFQSLFVNASQIQNTASKSTDSSTPNAEKSFDEKSKDDKTDNNTNANGIVLPTVPQPPAAIAPTPTGGTVATSNTATQQLPSTNNITTLTATVDRSNLTTGTNTDFNTIKQTIVSQAPIITDTNRIPPTPIAVLTADTMPEPVEAPLAVPFVPEVSNQAVGQTVFTASQIIANNPLTSPKNNVGTSEFADQFELTIRKTISQDNDIQSPQVSVLSNQPNVSSAPATIYRVATTQTTATPSMQLADAVIEHARVATKNETTEFNLQLNPASLGKVQVKLIANSDDLRAQVLVANDEVRRMVESQIPDLRQRLEAAGVSVSGFDVQTDTSGRSNEQSESSQYETRSRMIRDTAKIATITIPKAELTGRLDVTA